MKTSQKTAESTHEAETDLKKSMLTMNNSLVLFQTAVCANTLLILASAKALPLIFIQTFVLTRR